MYINTRRLAIFDNEGYCVQYQAVQGSLVVLKISKMIQTLSIFCCVVFLVIVKDKVVNNIAIEI